MRETLDGGLIYPHSDLKDPTPVGKQPDANYPHHYFLKNRRASASKHETVIIANVGGSNDESATERKAKNWIEGQPDSATAKNIHEVTWVDIRERMKTDTGEIFQHGVNDLTLTIPKD